ncbi:MAG: hypothetical protein KAR44_12155 [Candidatus Aegiribacteria sp.]|nr:hypothetical protein [Candidatus Aegiribacteria sp.]
MLSILLFFIASCGSPPDEVTLSECWETDLQWLADSLPGLHYNLFMYEPEDTLLNRLSRLEQNLDNLSDMETVMEMTRVLASMHCSHTGIAFWTYGDWTAYPISVMWLDEGLYVTAIDAEYSELIGSRLIEYGVSPAVGAAAAMSEMFPATNDVVRRTRAENFMMLAYPMEALGFGNVDSLVSFTFLEAAGDTVIVQFEAVDQSTVNMESFHDCESVILPLWLGSDNFYWFSYLSERRMLYCAYNSCALMDDYHIDDYVEDLRECTDSSNIDAVVVDLRRNSGGNSMVAAPLINWLRELSENSDIQLYLIIGRWTYSSGILNAIEISEIPGVMVFGENTGGAPNHLGEVRTAQLPWSGLSVSYPTKYFKRVEGEGSTMRPDVRIPLDAGMLFEGQNRILDAIDELLTTYE